MLCERKKCFYHRKEISFRSYKTLAFSSKFEVVTKQMKRCARNQNVQFSIQNIGISDILSDSTHANARKVLQRGIAQKIPPFAMPITVRQKIGKRLSPGSVRIVLEIVQMFPSTVTCQNELTYLNRTVGMPVIYQEPTT